ncbi:MAG: chain length determinant protein [Sphingopyxis sp.]|nr:chain length determinant protein [Sphingopyxis sp.]
MNITQFFRILWVRKAIILIALLASLLAGIAIVALVPRQYEATSRVLLEIIRPDPVTGEVMSSSFARAYTSTQIELIKDYRVAGRAVTKLGWEGSPELAAGYRASGSDQPFRRWLASQIIDGTEAKLIQGSNILEIIYTGSSAESAAIVANALREAYEEQTIEFKRQDARTNARWFQQQTAELRTKLAEAEKLKAEFEKTNDIILQDDNVDTDSARLGALAQTAPSASMMSAPPTVQVSGPGPAEMQLAQLDASIATASRTLGPNHPDYVALRQQRQVVANAAAQERAAAAANARNASVRPVATGPSPAAMFNAQRQKVLAQRGQLAEARQLASNVTVLRTQLNETQLKAAKSEQEAQSVDAGVTLLGSATPPDSASFPRTVPVILSAIVLGLGIGLLLALLFELLNRRVRGPEDLVFEGVPVIGMMHGTLGDAKPKRLGRVLRLAAPGYGKTGGGQ